MTEITSDNNESPGIILEEAIYSLEVRELDHSTKTIPGTTLDEIDSDDNVTRDKIIDTPGPDGTIQLYDDENEKPEIIHAETPVNTVCKDTAVPFHKFTTINRRSLLMIIEHTQLFIYMASNSIHVI